MRTTMLIAVILCLLGLPVSAGDGPSCSTSIVVETCGNAPVSARKIKVFFDDGGRLKELTDDRGRVKIEICADEVSEIKISGADPLKTTKVTVEDATDELRSVTITLNICQA